MGDDLKKLGVLIEIATNGGHRVSYKPDTMRGSAGVVGFGVDTGGAFITVNDGDRMTLDEGVTLMADLTNAICQARNLEWSKERGMRS